MIQEIRPGLFLLKVPLPGSSLKHLNAYVIRSPHRPLVVDTGMNHPVCRAAMLEGLTNLGVDLHRCDFFITHLHTDHLGLVSELAGAESTVYFNKPDADIMGQWHGWGPLADFAQANGYPRHEIDATLGRLPGDDIGARALPRFTLLVDGDPLAVGDYRFTCIQTPGHSFGHMCLYEAGHKLLIAGDHLLADISPSLQCWREESNPLQGYLGSLERVENLAVDLVLPGHRRLITDCKARISQLRRHHEERCREVTAIVAQDARNGYEVASLMNWEIRCDSWALFPPVQKWFAFGEAMAHLKYLEAAGRVARNVEGGIARYTVRFSGRNPDVVQ